MGLKGEAAIVGFVELPAERHTTRTPRFTMEQYAELSAAALEDAGLRAEDVDGLCVAGLSESDMFGPSTLSEYLGISVNYGERVDLGGATAVGMVWRAAAAIELGLCDVVLCAAPGLRVQPQPRRPRGSRQPAWLGASSDNYGSPQSEFEIPYGNLGQTGPYAQIAQRYAYEFGYDPRATAKIAADQRTSAVNTPGAAFNGQPATIDDVLASRMITDPLHLLECVMPVDGGAAVVVANADYAKRAKNRPVWLRGFGERIVSKTPTYAEDLMTSPVKQAADQAFAMAGIGRGDVDMVSLYDCFTITVLMSLEDAGFCAKGEGMKFVLDHDLSYAGDFPLNTAGGQLSYGQAGLAGGMHHVVDGARQLMGRAGHNQLATANRAFVSGNGGIMSEQAALVLEGD